MTIIIFILCILFEISFTIYSILTGSMQRKVRSYVRLMAFGAFLLLCITTVIEWGLCWYILGAVLLMLSIKGIYDLTKSKNNPKQFLKRNAILKAIMMVFLFAFALLPAFLFPQYEELQPTGEYKVATAQYTFTSDTIIDYYTGDKRSVNVGFWYPENAEEKFPLLVFSHGAYGIKNSNTSCYQDLASNGYIVCSIDHPGHSFYTESVEGKVVLVNQDYMKEVNDSNKDGIYTKAQCYELIKKWMRIRTEDINLTIDTILQNTVEADKAEVFSSKKADNATLYQLIDSSKIGVFGHSMGAAASVQMGREREDVDAVINIDGPYFSEMVYDKNKDELIATEKKYDTPILNIYSDQVWVQLKDGTNTGVYAGNKISNQICKESYDVYLKGTKHLTLTDLSLVSPFLANLLNGQEAEVDTKATIELENRIILEFFDAKLKNKGKFDANKVYE